MLEFQKNSIEMKNCKNILWSLKSELPEGNYWAFPQSPTQPPSDKILLRLWNKNFLTEIQINIQMFAFKVLQECSSLASGNGADQIFFLTPNMNMLAGKFVKWEKFLTVLREHIIFSVKEVRKMSEVFWLKLYCEMSDIFC